MWVKCYDEHSTPLRFCTNRFVAPTTPCIEILGTGNKNVVINSPLIYKPYIAFYFTSGAISSTIEPGYVSRSSISLTARTTGTLYNFTFPAHPNGSNYFIIVQARTGSTTTSYFTCTSNVLSSTSFNIWCRNASNTIVDGEFYAYTVP